jgi:hypothetical protein
MTQGYARNLVVDFSLCLVVPIYIFIPLIAAGDSISDKKISKRGYNLMFKSNFP